MFNELFGNWILIVVIAVAIAIFLEWKNGG